LVKFTSTDKSEALYFDEDSSDTVESSQDEIAQSVNKTNWSDDEILAEEDESFCREEDNDNGNKPFKLRRKRFENS